MKLTTQSENWRRRLSSFQTEAPVNVVAFAESLGMRVYEVQDQDPNFSGMIKRDELYGGKAGYSILVNSSHAKTRKRFTVAHETAHFLLHKSKIGDGLKDDALYRSGLSTWEEVQANRLAAEILMPFPLLEKSMRSGVTSVEQLAREFEVSREAMSIRLELPVFATG